VVSLAGRTSRVPSGIRGFREHNNSYSADFVASLCEGGDNDKRPFLSLAPYVEMDQHSGAQPLGHAPGPSYTQTHSTSDDYFSFLSQVIGELDEKKAQALHLTWEKVNKDFGSIFSTLLPGTMAKLEPPEGGSVLDGLEVRVAFGTVWKESLTELSGGQRSLLALSLILALLLFKPAPIYILDEVDAALDLSHTQNIGYVPQVTWRLTGFANALLHGVTW